MKKVGAMLLVVAMTVSMILGCTSNGDTKEASESSGETSGDSVEIEFQQWFDNEMEEGYLQSVCDSFYEETGIKVKLLSNPYADTKTQLQASAVAGTMADVVALDGSWIYDYATQGMLMELNDLFGQIGFDTGDISVQTSVNGTVYAQPLVNFPCLMAVNRGILKDAGVTKMPETWTDRKSVV